MICSDSGSLNCHHPRALTKCLLGNSRGTIHTTRSSCIRHWWNEDVTAFLAELDALKSSACGPDGVFAESETIVSEFLAKKQKHVAEITEVSVLYVSMLQDLGLSPTTACPPLCGLGEGPECRS